MTSHSRCYKNIYENNRWQLKTYPFCYNDLKLKLKFILKIKIHFIHAIIPNVMIDRQTDRQTNRPTGACIQVYAHALRYHGFPVRSQTYCSCSFAVIVVVAVVVVVDVVVTIVVVVLVVVVSSYCLLSL